MNITDLGLDAAIISNLGVASSNNQNSRLNRYYWGLRRRLPIASLRVVPYEKVVKNLIPNLSEFNFQAYPCVLPNWDNTPRCGKRGLVLTGSTPELFQMHLRQGIKAVQNYPEDHKLVFLKSWNEWGEGNHLEPCSKYGKEYLTATKEICDSVKDFSNHT